MRFYTFIVTFILFSFYAPALEAQTPWLEENGLLVIEMESAENFSGWTVDNTITGATGGNYISWNSEDQFFNETGNGVIKYPIRISQPGTYRFEWRVAVGFGEETTEHNDTWLKINATEYYAVEGNSELKPRPECGSDPNFECPEGSTLNGFFKLYGGGVRTWRWAARTSDNDPHQIFADFDTPGDYEIELNTRSSFHGIDRLIMYHSSVSQSNARALSNPESPRATPSTTAVSIDGELRKWHDVQLTFDGPTSSETASPNPFADYALEVTFTQGTTSYTVPGYFAADGNGAETSATSGNKWRVHFAPDLTGTWNYTVSFKQGTDVAVNGGGTSAGFMDGTTGTFNVAATDKTGRDHRGKGRLQYVGEHYLRYGETGEWFVKAGADAPENTLAYEDFDDVPNEGNRRKDWQPHAQDYNAAEAAPYTWNGGKGSELLGAVSYLSDKGVNAFSFLTFNVQGDDNNVFPHLLRVSANNYGGDDTWTTGVHHDRFDVSRLAQWERIFSYADLKGMYLHFKLQETENDKLMDGGDVGRERRLYYRELIARFGHHLALNWNIGEENRQTDQQRKDMAAYFAANDPYNHLRVIHTYPLEKDLVYTPLLGSDSEYTGLSLQTNNPNQQQTATDTRTWVSNSADAGKKWVVAVDEPGSASIGVDSDPDDRKLTRHRVVWGNLMAGGGGTEFYYGYQSGCGDLDCQDHRSRDEKYTDAALALRFFELHFQSFLPTVVSSNGLTDNVADYVLASPDQAYAVYLPDGGSTDITLPDDKAWQVQWYNPRTGTISSGSLIEANSITAPDGNDWTALITEDNNAACNVGAACDDGDACTENDILGADCSCAGVPTDGTETLQFDPIQDAYLQEGQLFNTEELRVELARRTSYLQFDLSAVSAPITAIDLQLTVGSDPGDGTVVIYLGSDANWTEANLDNTTPTQGMEVATLSGTFSSDVSYTWPIAVSDLPASGPFTLIIRHESGNDISFRSRENAEGSGLPTLNITTPAAEDCNALPVTWRDLSGVPLAKANLITWSVTEADVDRYTIQHAGRDGLFVDVGRVAASPQSTGEQTYSFTHTEVAAGIHYYRIVATDFDGSQRTSPTVNLTRQATQGPEIFPNPFSNFTEVRLNGDTGPLILTSQLGQQLAVFTPTASGRLRLDLSHLPAGVYVLSSQSKSGAAWRRLLFKR